MLTLVTFIESAEAKLTDVALLPKVWAPMVTAYEPSLSELHRTGSFQI